MQKAKFISLGISGLGLFLILGLLLHALSQQREDQTARSSINLARPVPDNINPGGAFTLTDMNARQVTQADYAGRFLLIYFGFTYCPDVCPTGLDRMGAALDTLAARDAVMAARIQPLFITIDPARDTPDTMADYVKYFHPRLIGLSGTSAQIDAVKRAYRVYAAKIKNPDNPDNYTMDHSSFFYLMDGQNRFVKHFDHLIDPTRMADILARLVR